MPTNVPRERFEELVADALDSIPAELGEQMDNVVVVVDEWARPDQRAGRDGTLLGLYEGVDLTRRSPLSYELAVPDRITIFSGPMQQLARDEEDLRRQIRVTVLHEVGHHFGISDARLGELGWG